MDINTLTGRRTLSQQHLHAQLAVNIDQEKLFAALDADPNLAGAGVVYVDSKLTAVTLREFTPVCRLKPIRLIIREPFEPVSEREHADMLSTSPRESKLVMESVSAGLACAGMVISWFVVVGSAATIPLTGGASTAVTVLGYTAATATTLQCVNGVTRTSLEHSSPETLDALDSNEWYTNAQSAVDWISLAGATASGLATIRMVKMMQRSGSTTREALQGLNRSQRRRLTEEVIRMNRPGISNGMRKSLVRSGAFPKRYSNVQIQQATKVQISDAVAAGLAFTGSSLAGEVRNLAIGVYEEL